MYNTYVYRIQYTCMCTCTNKSRLVLLQVYIVAIIILLLLLLFTSVSPFFHACLHHARLWNAFPEAGCPCDALGTSPDVPSPSPCLSPYLALSPCLCPYLARGLSFPCLSLDLLALRLGLIVAREGHEFPRNGSPRGKACDVAAVEVVVVGDPNLAQTEGETPPRYSYHAAAAVLRAEVGCAGDGEGNDR